MTQRKAQSDIITLLEAINEKQDKQMDKINDIHTKQEVANLKLERVEILAAKTNGRVTKLEGWRNYLTALITIVGTGLTLLASKFIGKE